jgi:regulatory protein
MSSSGSSPEVERCLDAAYNYLSYRPRSEAELRIYLKRHGYGDYFIESVLARLKQQGVVDDVAFAQFWRDNRESFSPRGSIALRLELRRKGINSEIIAETISEIDEENSAYKAAQKKAKLLASSDYSSFHHKLSAYLWRRGFNYELTRRVVKRLWQERSEKEQNA